MRLRSPRQTTTTTVRPARRISQRISGVTAVALVFGLGVPPGPTMPPASAAVSEQDACPPALIESSGFVDVSPAGAHGATINCLAGWGLLQGHADGRFLPRQHATRAQFVTTLYELLTRAGRLPAAAPLAFRDVSSASATAEAIAALAGAGIVNGTTADTFAPHRPIERGQMATLIVQTHARVFDGTLRDGPSFPDTAGSIHEANIRRLAGAGITVGYADGTFRSTERISREQLATFLTRYLDVLVADGDLRVPEPPTLRLRRVGDPDRTIVEDAQGTWLGTFTDGARTVALAGPERRFDEATASHGVTSRTWVRLLARPFSGTVDRAWLAAARMDRSPDVLATSMQYLAGAPDVRAGGLLLAGDSAYGPLRSDGSRPIGSDWHDYQGITATYATGTNPARTDRYRSMDCSGFVRMVFGVRFGLPLGRPTDGGQSLPRVSRDQAAEAPGITPYTNQGTRITDRSRLQPGDLVFFDASSRGGSDIDHVGIYLGEDDGGRHRFISSRRSSNGPTMGDHRGPSVLDGDWLYARSFRATRRL